MHQVKAFVMTKEEILVQSQPAPVIIKNGWVKTVLENSITYSYGAISFKVIRIPGESFYFGETEVTKELWGLFAKTNEHHSHLLPEHPIVNVSYRECEAFLLNLSKHIGQSFRFPTESEWEKAARGGTQSKGFMYPGANNLDDVAWWGNCGLHPVKEKKPNEIGLFDMLGSAWEWCSDDLIRQLPRCRINPTILLSEPTHCRPLKGGSFINGARTIGIDKVKYLEPYDREVHTGLRLVHDLDESDVEMVMFPKNLFIDSID